MSEKLRVVVMTQNDRFFIPKNIEKAARVCDMLEIVEVDSKYSLDNQKANYLKWFGPFQCAKMGFVTVGRELEKVLDRLCGYRLFHGHCSVRDVAKANGIAYRLITKSNDPEFVRHIRELNTDLIISSRHSREEEIRSWFESTGKEPHFIVKTAHSSNASKLVDQNIGIAIFPASVAKNISADSNVVVKKITPAVNVDYILSWDKEKIPSALAMKFIEHVRGLYS